MQTNAPLPRAIQTAAEGAQLLAQLRELLEVLLSIVEEETELVRNGRIVDVARLEPKKAELAGQYYAMTQRLKANAKFLSATMPDKVAELRHRHDVFRSLLQINLTVLATAHAVSEGIVRGVAGEITRKAAPQTYGVSGRANAPAANAARPVAISRTS
jgi:flagellar biosynthesis/type III secretory pathway chaperone